MKLKKYMGKRLGKISLYILLIVIAVIHSYYLSPMYSVDEIWIYGFSSNILRGLSPYKDFSLVIGPIFPYLLAIFLSIFSKKLIVYHILVALMTVSITYIAFLKIKHYALLIYLLLLIYPCNAYNIFTLLLLFILLKVIDKDNKDTLEVIIISLMILTKQSLIVMVIPHLILSKNKRKALYSYLIVFLLFLLYLIIFNNLSQFINYCILGLFDFAYKNILTPPLLIILEIILISILLTFLITSLDNKKEILYVLMYQIIVYPILCPAHLVLSLVTVLYLIFKNKEVKVLIKKSLFLVMLILSIFLIFTNNEMFLIRDKEVWTHYQEDCFMKGRLVPSVTSNYIQSINNIVNNYKDYKLYILGTYSYTIKLSLDIPINKFDLINNGNMGYKGSEKYITEIHDTCLKNKCLFIVNEKELNIKGYNQTNKEILKYAVNNYNRVYSTNMFGVYLN